VFCGGVGQSKVVVSLIKFLGLKILKAGCAGLNWEKSRGLPVSCTRWRASGLAGFEAHPFYLFDIRSFPNIHVFFTGLNWLTKTRKLKDFHCSTVTTPLKKNPLHSWYFSFFPNRGFTTPYISDYISF
jgi:hypothetical protein